MEKAFVKYRVMPFVVVLVALLPVMLLRDFTPDNELRYLSIADEALRDGRFFAFTNHGVAYADKPPLYLWIVMLGKCLFGHHSMVFLSMFSLLPAFVIAEVMRRWAAPVLGRDFGAEAMLLLMTCGLFTGMMVVLRMDMLMTMWIVLACYVFFRWQGLRRLGGALTPAANREVRRYRILFPLFIFLGVFTKGPMGILIPLVSTAVYLWQKGKLRQFGVYWGWRAWCILLVLCACWFGAVYAEGGAEYLDNLLFHQTVDRAVNSFHHKRPFHYYLISLTYCLLPWTFLILGTVVAAFTRRARFRTDTERFFLLSGVSTIVLLSFISGKIQVYMLPAYPFFVYLAAIYMSRYRESRLLKASVAVPLVILCVAGVAVWFISGMEGGEPLRHWQIYVAGGILAVASAASLVMLYRRHDVACAVRIASYGLLLTIFTAAWATPQFNNRLGYGEMCAKGKALHDANGADGYQSWRVRRVENVDVYLGEEVRIVADSVENPEAALPPGKWVLFENRDARIVEK